MSMARRFVLSVVSSLVIWLAFSWPLVLHIQQAIPSSSRNIEKGQMRDMIPGDHLQLLYHFWLAGDMLAGKTPPFYNLYEFNTGDDEARYYPSAYFFPFSFVYAGIASIGGRALGWNLTGWLSLWLTLHVTWVLMRRFVDNDWVAGAGALVSLVFPFRWVMLLGGSPAGFGMVWIPVVLLGLALAITERSVWGGCLAGVGLLLACWGDVQSFFFLVLFTPIWCLWLALVDYTFHWNRNVLTSLSFRLLPVPLFVGLAMWYRSYFSSHMPNNLLENGRSLSEVHGFSPDWGGLFTWNFSGIHNHIYIGYVLVLVVVLGLFATASRSRKNGLRIRNRFWAYLVLVVVVGGCVVLALGVNGPWDGAFLKLMRRVIPPYMMVRQPARIFVLLPSVLALLSSLGLSCLLAGRSKSFRAVALIVFAVLLVSDMKIQVRATLCGLDHQQGAYEAVAKAAETQGVRPHVLVVPIWPGDSDLSAVYQYDASLYRIRMVNGYSPVITRDYVDHVFRALDSVNQGWLSKHQIDLLTRMGVGYVVVHEDAFPEKVSPFPIGFTLDRLRANPYLDFLAQDGPVWAFRILDTPKSSQPAKRIEKTLFPTRRYEAEHLVGRGLVTNRSDSASGGAFITLGHSEDMAVSQALRITEAPGLRWMVRARGNGLLRVGSDTNQAGVTTQLLAVSTTEWTWHDLDLSDFAGYGPTDVRFDWQNGTVDLDFLHLTGGPWRDLVVGEVLTLPANWFFHAGHSTRESTGVLFRRERDDDSTIFYGLHLPLVPGEYLIELDFESMAGRDSWLGVLYAGNRSDDKEHVDVLSGRSAVVTFVQRDNFPVRVEFKYGREADVEVKQVTITRLK